MRATRCTPLAEQWASGLWFVVVLVLLYYSRSWAGPVRTRATLRAGGLQGVRARKHDSIDGAQDQQQRR
jgi:hypothetical protein